MGAAVAFLATAGAFLLFASLDLATSDPIPRAEPARDPGSVLALELPENRLEGLEREPGQKLALDVENRGDEELASVDLALGVASEDTARPDTRYYQRTVEGLAQGETITVEFEIDLSSPSASDRGILEFRATTPDGDSAVKTVVLAPPRAPGRM